MYIYIYMYVCIYTYTHLALVFDVFERFWGLGFKDRVLWAQPFSRKLSLQGGSRRVSVKLI